MLSLLLCAEFCLWIGTEEIYRNIWEHSDIWTRGEHFMSSKSCKGTLYVFLSSLSSLKLYLRCMFRGHEDD